MLITLAERDAAMVRDLAAAIDTHFEDFRASDPGAIGWARDRQILDWVVPYHDGAVAWWREAGVWTDAHQAHNDALVRRQEVLAEAWRAHRRAGGGADAWLGRRAEALAAAGFDPLFAAE
jgi:TRAP-type uncharacterized transport system, periplasmic component